MQVQAPKNEKWFLSTLGGMEFTHVLDFMVMVPLGPQLIRALHLQTADFGLLLSCYALGAAAAGLLASNLIDRFDRRRASLFLYLFFMLATMACALADSFIALLLARTLAGACGGLTEAMVHTMVAETIPYERRGAASSLVGIAFSLSAVIGVPFGLLLSNAFPVLGWRAPFLLLAALCAVFLLCAWIHIPSLRLHLETERHGNTTWQTLADKKLRMALQFVLLVTLGGFLVTPFVPLYLTSNVGISEAFLPVIYFFAGIASLFSSRWIGKMADRHGKQKVFAWVALAAFLPLLTITHLPPLPSWLVLCIVVTLFVLVPGRMIAAMPWVCSLPQAHLRGSFMSLIAAIQMLGIGIASLVAGALLTRTASGQILHFDWCGYLALASGVLALYWMKKLDRMR